MLNIPNTLTLLRIAAIPAILIALDEAQFGIAFALFVAAGVTDSVDGAIARLTNTRTDLGAYLDPLADKGLVLSLLLKLTWMGLVPQWAFTIILTRDVVCMTGYVLLFFLTGERMSTATFDAIKAAVDLEPLPAPPADDSVQRLNRVRIAVYLTLISPDFLVQ